MATTTEPRAPQRQSTLDADGVLDEPPPAYSAQPDGSTVDVGPRHPFGFTDHEPIPPPHHNALNDFAPPPQHPHHHMPTHDQYSTSYSSYNRPPLSGSPNGYGAPSPPGPPPREQVTGHHTGGSHASSAEGDDGPTTRPVPGRVLMHNGRVLVYPKDYVCSKCKNTGYKNFDPSAPCKKCWDKYGKPWNIARVSPEGTHLTQKPLPNAPNSSGNSTLSPSNTGASFAPPPSRPPQGQPYYAPPNRPPWQAGPGQYQPYQPNHPLQTAFGPTPNTRFVNAPPPGALIVQPGDPRIGGVLCNYCNGQGFIMTGFGFIGMGFEEQCYRCNGTGRIF